MIGGILIGKMLHQCGFFIGNASMKKGPCGTGIQTKAHGIAKKQLCPNRPIKEPKITRMPPISIDSVGNQNVTVLLLLLNDMIEGFATCLHGQRSTRLSHDNQQQSHDTHTRRKAIRWKQPTFDPKLRPRNLPD
jgi:hypothetical protein